MATSADGKIIMTVGSAGSTTISTNAGVSWTTNYAYYGSAIATSADGTKAIAALNQGIYLSTNSGITWQPNTATSNHWVSLANSADGSMLFSNALPNHSIACSSDGTHIIVAGMDGTFFTTNSGASWTVAHIVADTVASSADGSKLIAIDSGESQINTSSDYGSDWTSTNITGTRWYSVASSADGGELLASENGSGVWIY